MLRARIAISIALLLTMAACATRHPYYVSHTRCPANAENEPKGPPEAPKCFDIPEVQAYLEGIREKVYDAWDLPLGISADQQIAVKMRIDAAGAVQCLTVHPEDASRLTESILTAIERSDPFPAMPPETACLAGLPIVGTFRNPVDDGSPAG